LRRQQGLRGARMTLLLLALLQEPDPSTLIRLLDDDNISVRRRAAEDLTRRGRSAQEALWRAMIHGESLEVRLSAEEILDRTGAGRLYTVTDSVRLFARMKDDPPQVDFDR